MDVIQGRDGFNVVQTSYTRAGGTGGLLAKTTIESGAPVHLYYHYDGGGNGSQLTDATGAVIARYSYDAWGETVESSGVKSASNRYRYRTKERHEASGLYDFGFRFYNTGLGRFINRDPIAESGGLNLYAFAANDPVGKTDEYGLSAASALASFGRGVKDGLLGGGMTAV